MKYFAVKTFDLTVALGHCNGTCTLTPSTQSIESSQGL